LWYLWFMKELAMHDMIYCSTLSLWTRIDPCMPMDSDPQTRTNQEFFTWDYLWLLNRCCTSGNARTYMHTVTCPYQPLPSISSSSGSSW
jgi:hypothetical protein